MKTARLFASQTHCMRFGVGSALVDRDTGRLLATGYNGTVKGFLNCDDCFKVDDKGRGWVCIENLKKLLELYEVNDTYKINPRETEEINGLLWTRLTDSNDSSDTDWNWLRNLHHRFSLAYEVHSEVNAIMSLCKAGNTVPFSNIDLYVTTFPCDQCLKTIACAGIKKVFYEKDYDRQDSVKMIERAKMLGVTISKLDIKD